MRPPPICCAASSRPARPIPFGTDNLGRDIFSRVILGARGALTIALTVVGVAMLIGVPLGLIAGYRGGWLSETIMRVTDVVLAIPQLVLALALAQLMSPSLLVPAVAFCAVCRSARSSRRSLRVRFAAARRLRDEVRVQRVAEPLEALDQPRAGAREPGGGVGHDDPLGAERASSVRVGRAPPRSPRSTS